MPTAKYDKTVKGATKIKLAAPKAKYVEPILDATNYPEDIESIIWSLGTRLGDSNWTVSYKALLIIHIMIREGVRDATLKALTRQTRIFDAVKNTNNPYNISRYARYLRERVVQYSKTHVDYVRSKSKNGGRLRNLTVDKGLLRECDSVLDQINALLKCRFQETDVDNDIVLTAFRFLVRDLLVLYQVLNEGVINVLEHYFEMSKVDTEHGLDIYKRFTKQTNSVVQFLRIAKALEYQTKLHVPNIKHAPVSLTQSLEDYLNDPDFEINHRQFIAEKQAREASGFGKSEPAPEQANASTGVRKKSIASLTASAPAQADNSTTTAQQTPGFDDTNPFRSMVASAGNQQQLLMQNITTIIPNQNDPNTPGGAIQANISFPLQDAQMPSGIVIQPHVVPVDAWGQPITSAQTQQQMQQAQLQAQQQAQQQAQAQQALQAQQQAQLQQFQTQQPNPQQPLSTMFTGAGFGGYSTTSAVVNQQQPNQLNQTQQPQQQQQPFGTPSTMATTMSNAPTPLSMQSTTSSGLSSITTGSNPFRNSQQGHTTGNPFIKRSSTVAVPSSGGMSQQPTLSMGMSSSLPNSTGQPTTGVGNLNSSNVNIHRSSTNPFSSTNNGLDTLSSQGTATPLQLNNSNIHPNTSMPSTQTAELNPFRQSVTAGMGGIPNNGYQTSLGGLDNLQSVGMFSQNQQLQAHHPGLQNQQMMLQQGQVQQQQGLMYTGQQVQNSLI